MSGMSRRRFLRDLGGAAAGLAGWRWLGRAAWAGASATASAPAAGRPNFVFILVDDLGWRDLGCYGSRFHRSPHLDRLAADGMRFTDAYAACPVCSPTRASILTGMYPARFGITDWFPGSRPPKAAKLRPPKTRTHLPTEAVTIAEYLKPAGYATGYIGKWHLGGRAYWPEKQGFDVNIAGNARGQPPRYFSPYRMERIADGPAGEYLTDRLTDEACRFITAHKDRPFFLLLSHFAVHTPLQAKAETIAAFRARADKSKGQHNPTYAAMIAAMDDGVGKVMKTLADLKLADNTVVIFFSDNGGDVRFTSNRPLYGGKSMLFEGGIRVPLIVRFPRAVKPGTVCRTPVMSTDFLPTMLEMARVKPRAAAGLDGASLVPLLRQRGAPKRDTLYWHYPHYQGGAPCGAVRQGRWKLIDWYETGRTGLFDLTKDPGEKTNLTASMPAKAAELRAALAAWRKRVGAAMPTPNPNRRGR